MTPRQPRSTRRQHGFTLLELLLGLSLVAAILTLAFGGLRLGVNAWRQGEDRAEAQEHARNLQLVLSRALAGVHPYRGQQRPEQQPEILFEGEPTRIAFVTVSPPVPSTMPVAFSAVTISLESGKKQGLAIRQKVLPNFEPFEPVEPTLLDRSVTGLRLRYQSERDGAWTESWDTVNERALPRTVEMTLTVSLRGRVTEHPPIAVPIRVAAP
jgi:general secretion pathway protein J